MQNIEADMNVSASAEDIAMMRQLAEEGRMQPLQGGRYLVMWGLLSSLGLSFTASIVAELMPFSPVAIMIFWFAVMGIGVFFTIRWSRQAAECPESNSIGNQVEAMVWKVGGMFLGLVSTMLFALTFLANDKFAAAGINPSVLFSMMAPIAFGVYAIALAATAVAGKAGWLFRYVVLAFIFAALTLVLVWDLKQFLAAIAGIVLVIIIPGFIMLDKSRQA